MAKAYRDEQDEIKKEKIRASLMKLPPYIEEFNENMELKNRKVQTRFTYIRVIESFFRYLSSDRRSPISGKGVMDITLDDLDGLKVQDIERFIIGVGGKPSTRNNYSSALSTLFAFLYNKDKISHNVMPKVDRSSIKRYEKEVVRLTDAQSVGFIDAVRTGAGLSKKQEAYFKENGIRDLAICLTLLRTGLRVSELVGIDIGDINLDENYISVIRKGNKRDSVYFDDETKDAIYEYIETRTKKTKDSPLFLSTYGNTKGKRITVRQVEHLVKKYTSVGAKGTGTGVSPHKLRATFATAMLNETGNITLVQAQLSHENIQTTSLYIDKTSQEKKAARNLLMKRGERARELENPLSDAGAKIYNETNKD